MEESTNNMASQLYLQTNDSAKEQNDQVSAEEKAMAGIKEQSTNSIRALLRAKAIQMARIRIQESPVLYVPQTILPTTIANEETIETEKEDELLLLMNSMSTIMDCSTLFNLFHEVNTAFERASDEEKAQFCANLLNHNHLIDALKKLIINETQISIDTSLPGTALSILPCSLQLLSKIMTEHVESVAIFMRKGYIDALSAYFMAKFEIDSSLVVFQFFEKAILVDESTKAIILTSIPIQYFLFLFMEPLLQAHPTFLPSLACFLNKCCLINSPESNQTVSQSLTLFCLTALNEFIEVLHLNILSSDISIHLSEIIMHCVSGLLRDNQILSVSTIEQIRKLIAVQIKSEFTPLLIHLVNLITKVFSNHCASSLMDFQSKMDAIKILDQAVVSKVRTIRSSSIPGISNLLCFWEDSQTILELINRFTPQIEHLFSNESKAIKCNCLDFFSSVLARFANVDDSVIPAGEKLEKTDRLASKVIEYVKIESFEQEELTDISFKIIDLLESSLHLFNRYLLNQQQNQFSNRPAEILFALSKISFESNVQQLKNRILSISNSTFSAQ